MVKASQRLCERSRSVIKYVWYLTLCYTHTIRNYTDKWEFGLTDDSNWNRLESANWFCGKIVSDKSIPQTDWHFSALSNLGANIEANRKRHSYKIIGTLSI